MSSVASGRCRRHSPVSRDFSKKPGTSIDKTLSVMTSSVASGRLSPCCPRIMAPYAVTNCIGIRLYALNLFETDWYIVHLSLDASKGWLPLNASVTRCLVTTCPRIGYLQIRVMTSKISQNRSGPSCQNAMGFGDYGVWEELHNILKWNIVCRKIFQNSETNVQAGNKQRQRLYSEL
jgi:hypothetical protein